jgi:hypothetical protein
MKVTRASWPVACSDTYRVSPSATTPNGRDAVGSARFLIVSVPVGAAEREGRVVLVGDGQPFVRRP